MTGGMDRIPEREDSKQSAHGKRNDKNADLNIPLNRYFWGGLKRFRERIYKFGASEPEYFAIFVAEITFIITFIFGISLGSVSLYWSVSTYYHPYDDGSLSKAVQHIEAFFKKTFDEQSPHKDTQIGDGSANSAGSIKNPGGNVSPPSDTTRPSSEETQENLLAVQDETAWETALHEDTVTAYATYLNAFASGAHAEDAKKHIANLIAKAAESWRKRTWPIEQDFQSIIDQFDKSALSKVEPETLQNIALLRRANNIILLRKNGFGKQALIYACFKPSNHGTSGVNEIISDGIFSLIKNIINVEKCDIADIIISATDGKLELTQSDSNIGTIYTTTIKSSVSSYWSYDGAVVKGFPVDSKKTASEHRLDQQEAATTAAQAYNDVIEDLAGQVTHVFNK